MYRYVWGGEGLVHGAGQGQGKEREDMATRKGLFLLAEASWLMIAQETHTQDFQGNTLDPFLLELLLALSFTWKYF